jgi:hypothetical protein
MTKLERIKSEIESLPHREYMKLVNWFSERDASAGKLDFLIQEALGEKEQGKLGSV